MWLRFLDKRMKPLVEQTEGNEECSVLCSKLWNFTCKWQEECFQLSSRSSHARFFCSPVGPFHSLLSEIWRLSKWSFNKAQKNASTLVQFNYRFVMGFASSKESNDWSRPKSGNFPCSINIFDHDTWATFNKSSDRYFRPLMFALGLLRRLNLRQQKLSLN